jgi:hypothetical protein
MIIAGAYAGLNVACCISTPILLQKRQMNPVPVAHPVILATGEAEIRRITAQGQPGKVAPKTISQKFSTQPGAGDSQHLYPGGSRFNANPGQIVHDTLS